MKKLPLLIALILFFGNLQSQITAEFTIQPYDNCGGASSPVTVVFVDQSISPGGSITDWVWDFGDGNTSQQFSPIHTYVSAANYSVCLTVTNSAGESDTECKTDYISISDFPVCTILPPGNLDCNTPTVTLDGGLSSTGPDFEFLWSTTNGNIVSGSNTTNAIVNSPGLYILEVTDIVNGCSSNAAVEVNSDANTPTAIINAPPILSCTNQSITLDGTGSSTGPEFSYLWTTTDGIFLFNSATSLNPFIGSAGTYTLTVTDQINGCTSSSSVLVTADINFPFVNIQNPAMLSCANPTVTLDGTGSSTSPDFTYEWKKGNFVISTNISTTVSSAGIYTLEVSNANMSWCSVEKEVTIENDGSGPMIHLPVNEFNDTIYNCQEVINYSADLMDASCTNCTVEIRDANDTLISNSLPWAFDLSDPAWLNYYPLYPFSINITDNNIGCSSSTILPNPPNQSFFLTSSVTDENCSGNADGSIDLSVSGTAAPYIYDWEDLPGTNDPLDRTGLVAGTYTLYITDAFGCDVSAPDGFDYEVESNLMADVSASQTEYLLNCITPSVTLPLVLDGSNSSTGINIVYEWYNSNNILVGDSIVVEVFDLDDYYLIVKDTVLQCSDLDYLVFDITSDVAQPNIVIDPSPSTTLTCIDGTITLDASGSMGGNAALVFEWYYLGVAISTTSILEVTQPGEYELVVTDTDNGCAATSMISINENITPPTVHAGPDLVLTCLITSVVLDGTATTSSGNMAYEWFDPNNNSISISQNANVSQPGTYTLIVTDTDNGCTASDQVTVSADTNLPSTSINANTLVCPGSMVMIDLAVPCLNCSIEVLDGVGNIVCTTFPCEIDPANGPFQITVTDLNTGCQNVDNFTISVPNPIVIGNSEIMDVSCLGGNDGSIEIDVFGGSAPYTFNWSNGSLAEDQFNLSSGIYSVSIIDVNGCELEESFTIYEPDPIQITNVIVTNVSCIGTNDGDIAITVSGGTSPYSYLWSNGGLPSNGLATGIYNLTITDTNGCTFVSPDYEIIQNVCFDFSNDTTICVGGIVPLSDENPVAGFNYSWTPATGINNPNIPNPIASPSETTTYFLTITDGNGMAIFNSQGPTVTVQNYLDFGLLLDFSNAPLCENDTLELYANLGTTFLWTGPNGFTEILMNPTINDVTESESGIYSLTITDDFGCIASVDVDVFIDDDCVWPGDTDTNMVVNHFDLLNIGLAYDSVGTIRENASFDWFGQPSFDWSQTTPTSNVNYKHIDADGNGIIEAADTVAITQNFGLTYSFSDPDILNQFTDLPPTDGFSVVTPFYVEPDTLIEGETIALDIILGDVSNLVVGLYGIGFTIEYDSSVVVPGSASINFDNCWLGDVDADAISIQFDFHNPGRIDAAITRIDGVEMDGYGLFGEFIITLEDDILLWNGGSNNFNGTTTTDVTTDFRITNYHLINFSQEEIIVQGMTTTAPIGETTSLSFVELNELIAVFPNPANDVFFIASQKIDIERVRIFSATGELKSVKTKTGNHLEISTKELVSGIYFVEIQTREGIVTKKLNVVR